MKKLYSSILLTSLLFLGFSTIDISVVKNQIITRLKEYSNHKYPEKVYVHTDKPYYSAGENIWFSAYLVNGVTHTKASKSSVIYVELLNDKGDIISERKLFSETVIAEGDFKLPVDLEDGSYILRAYTNYMRNQPTEYFFTKTLPIFSLYSDTEGTDPITEGISSPLNISQLPDIGFYPEGGYLINDLRNKVAIRIKNAEINAPIIAGSIEDSDGNKVTDFHTSEFGLGFFYLLPEPGKMYRAVIRSEGESVYYPLPNSLSRGYVMNTSLSKKELTIALFSNKNTGLKNTLVLGHQRGVPVFDYIENRNKESVIIKIPKNDLAEGVLDIVLFDDLEKPVAERLVYVKKDNEITVSVKKKNSTPTSTRERVDLQIDVRNLFSEVVPSSLSLSITDANFIRYNRNHQNIRTYLLLNSDLRGKIKSPNYFFTAGDEIKKNAQLDLIMMTHGWRRFDWLNFLENPQQEKFKAENGIFVSGHTIDAHAPYRYKQSETKIAFREQGFYQETQTTDKYGYFSYGPFVFNDTIDILFQAGEALSTSRPNVMDTNIILEPSIDNPPFEPIPNYISVISTDSLINETYRTKVRNHVFRDFEYDGERELLSEVNLKTKVETKEEIKNKQRNSRTRSFLPSHRVIVDDDNTNGAGNFMELLGGIPGVQVGIAHNAQTSQNLVVTLRGLWPSFYVDDVKVDLDYACSIFIADIDFIDILHTGPASAAYSLEAGGVIAIYTKQGSREKGELPKQPGSITFKYPGFYSARSFYSPDYSKADQSMAKKDERSTLYWNPHLTVTPYKNTEVTFYTSDKKGVFQAEIEGITDSGIPFFTTALFEVD